MNQPGTEFLALRFHFQSPLRLGRGRMDLSRGLSQMGSASLKAAFFSAAVRLYPVEEVVRELLHGVRISGTMPFGAGVDYLPVPLTGLDCVLPDAGRNLSWQKQLRKIRFCSRPLFERVLMGTALSPDELRLAGSYAHLVHERSPRIARRVGQRVAVPPPGAGEDSEPFFVEQTFFGEGAGQYALAKLAPEGSARGLDMLQAAFRLLEDESLGGGGSVGNGAFRGSVEGWRLSHPAPTGHWCLLGNFIPDPQDWGPSSLEGGAWKLERQGGFLARASTMSDRRLRRKALFLFGPGTVLTGKNAPLGVCLDQRPDAMSMSHPVWRDGRSIWIPIDPISHGKF